MRIRNLLDNRSGDLAVGLESIIDHFFGDEPNMTHSTCWAPRINIVESETSFVLTTELPGVLPEDVSLEMHEGSLTISGEKKLPETPQGSELVKSERRHGQFSRKFGFPVSIEADNISAEFKNGLLIVTLPKSAKDLPRKIEIGVSE
ncbi:MAG: Hsp20/alpha crystallin family protein [Planctomycetota bacterium]